MLNAFRFSFWVLFVFLGILLSPITGALAPNLGGVVSGGSVMSFPSHS